MQIAKFENDVAKSAFYENAKLVRSRCRIDSTIYRTDISKDGAYIINFDEVIEEYDETLMYKCVEMCPISEIVFARYRGIKGDLALFEKYFVLTALNNAYRSYYKEHHTSIPVNKYGFHCICTAYHKYNNKYYFTQIEIDEDGQTIKILEVDELCL